MKLKALSKDVSREFKRSFSRFLSILLIIALGVGFFAGMKAAAPSMVKTAEEYFDEYNLLDIKLLSVSGFGDEDVERIRKEVKGIRQIQPSYSVDVLAQLPDSDAFSAVKIVSLPEDVESAVNRPVLLEGRFPRREGECVVCKDNHKGRNYQIGNKIPLAEMAGSSRTDEVLRNTEYKVVGIVETPEYFTYSYGNTSVGDGSLRAIFFVAQPEFQYSRYTEVYLTLEYDRENVAMYSEEYAELVKKVSVQIDPIGVEQQAKFLKDFEKQLEEAQKEYDEKKDSAQEELEKSQKELEEAKGKLDSALDELTKGWETFNAQTADYEKQIADGQAKIDAAKKQVNQYKATIINSRKEIQNGENTLKKSRQELDDNWNLYQNGKKEYEAGVLELNASKVKLDEAKPQLDSGWAEYNTGLDQYNTSLAQYYTDLETYNNAKDLYDIGGQIPQIGPYIGIISGVDLALRKTVLDETKRQLDAAKLQLDDGLVKLQTSQAEYDEGLRLYNEGAQKLADAKIQLDTSFDQLNDGEIKYQDGIVQLENAKEELKKGEEEIAKADAEIARSEAELNAAKDKYNLGKNQLENAQKEYDEGKDAYDKGYAEYEAALVETERQLNDGAAAIASARNSFTEMSNKKWYIFNRDDAVLNYTGYRQDTERIDAIAGIFPVFFLIVAALVCTTTMSRMVEEQRSQMGAYKALGYSKGQIFSKYLKYSLVAGIVGGILGQTVCIAVFPKAIMSAYGLMYFLPPVKTVLPWEMMVLSLLVGIACTTLVAYICCRKELKDVAANLMRPKAPKAGKKIFLERFPKFWNRLSFEMKITVRNLIRYKLRFFMTVIGITGCMALIVSGFGLKNSISPIVDLQYKELSEYDFMTALYEPCKEEEVSALREKIVDCDVDELFFAKQAETTIKGNNGAVSGNETYLYVPEDTGEFSDLVHLRSASTGENVPLKEGGAVMTAKLAKTLGLSVGDKFTFTYDEEEYTVALTDVVENYVYHYLYLSPYTFLDLVQGDAEEAPEMTYNIFVGAMTEGKEVEPDKILSLDDNFLTVVRVTDICGTMDDNFKSMDLVVMILILSATCLAIVVLYNLTNINISERVREIATTKVLGFNAHESNMYIFRENIIMTVIGLVLGCLCGYGLAQVMISMVEVDVVTFSRSIQFTSYLFSSLITIATTALVILLMRRKIRKINMVEALKSVE